MKYFFFNHNNLINKLLSLPRREKTLLLMLLDYGLLVLCFEMSLSIRNNTVYWPTAETRLLILLAPLLAIPIFYFSGLYQSFVRYTSYHSIKVNMLGVTLYTAFWFFIVLIPELVERPYDFLVINWLLTVFLIGGIRFIARSILNKKSSSYNNVLIYGAGASGTSLASAIKDHPEYSIKGYIDDDPNKQGLFINDIKVFNPNLIEKIIKNKEINEILIAMPSLSKVELSKVLFSLKKYSVLLKSLPNISELVDGVVAVKDLKKIRIEDLLNRQIRQADQELLQQDITDKNILVTGAGGSIGSELCIQIIKLSPRLLVLFEINEHSLYKIERELLKNNPDTHIITILGDIIDVPRFSEILKKFDVQTIYHTAAYKHVPMVEKNIIPAVRCNILGTLGCIEASLDNNIESFVFISTDKAVRPTNIMGATKRFAELLLQAISDRNQSENKQIKTRISMVRFGNVLGSSGSVVPLFREQIEQGGPITVTDPKIIRYFMTINEAAQLVIQAGAMGKNGEIFLLDMGEPVQITNLAKDMITLSGLNIKDEKNPNGDIEIIYTGLRPGEKLYEEMLIDGHSEPTRHERIMKANEPFREWVYIQEKLKKLEEATKCNAYQEIQNIFIEEVFGYSPNHNGE